MHVADDVRQLQPRFLLEDAAGTDEHTLSLHSPHCQTAILLLPQAAFQPAGCLLIGMDHEPSTGTHVTHSVGGTQQTHHIRGFVRPPGTKAQTRTLQRQQHIPKVMLEPAVREAYRWPGLPFVVLIVISGLPGTGKSTVAAALARNLQATHLSIDEVENAMLGAGLSPGFRTGVAAYINRPGKQRATGTRSAHLSNRKADLSKPDVWGLGVTGGYHIEVFDDSPSVHVIAGPWSRVRYFRYVGGRLTETVR